MQRLRLLVLVHVLVRVYLDAGIERDTLGPYMLSCFLSKKLRSCFLFQWRLRCGLNYFRTRIRTKINYPCCKFSMIFPSSGNYYGYMANRTAHLIKDPKHHTGTVPNNNNTIYKLLARPSQII